MATTNGSHPLSPLDVLTLAEAAEYLKLPEDMVRAEAEAGRLDGRAVGADWRFGRVALLRWSGLPASVFVTVPGPTITVPGPVPTLPGPTSSTPRAAPFPSWTPQAEAECEAEIAAIHAARRARGTVGDLLAEEGDE